MAISNINLAMGASSFGAYQQRLTSATRAELESYGIPYNPDITEQEGKALLANYKTQNSNNDKAQNNFTNSHKQSNDLFERAKKLAEKLGIQVDENINFKTLLSQISQAIEIRLNANRNDESLLIFLFFIYFLI